MISLSVSLRLCRYTKCCNKILTTSYSARPVTKEEPLREPPWITVSSGSKTPLDRSKLSPEDLIPPAQVLAKKLDTSSIQNAKNLEGGWKELALDSTKLHKHCLALSKIRLTSLVVITTMGGYALAPGAFDPQTFVLCALGTGLVSATANSINQFFEVPFDAQMSRTKNRVLVRGHVTPAHAIAFATISGITGLSILYFTVNGLTAALGAANLVLYTLIYTPMKRVSILNTWVGSVVGAIPPLMGWAGCVGDILAPGAWIMSGMLYAWQFPHFNALSWNLRPDYSRAGYRMMAVTNPGLCRRTALRYTSVLMGLSYLSPMLEVTNWWFAAASTPLNAYFLYLAWQFNKKSDSASSRKLFRFSLIHLPILMLMMLCSKKSWASGASDETTSQKISAKVADLFETSTRLFSPTSA
ncbi:protoheme IX farnesyltransferase, mitochondrial [Diachasma alloeum]|uniref:protoheme IX farnesyltransferase, mitochondrial n=1 Tax=Diachasma alloeum TaxID=454923 RepID=UPI0007384053|nr:protoheme IX farnesyltransferase, mitochondrial [Diachasma alloeum]XP_015110279.1 protoheme IX farnesyltransferase, mitochondrial [Diachasma alloeum]